MMAADSLPLFDHVFNFRYLCYTLGIGLPLFWIVNWAIKGQDVLGLIGRWDEIFRRHFRWALLALCSGFFLLGWAGKYSQFVSLGLNGQDFWLFVDILE